MVLWGVNCLQRVTLTGCWQLFPTQRGHVISLPVQGGASPSLFPCRPSGLAPERLLPVRARLRAVARRRRRGRRRGPLGGPDALAGESRDGSVQLSRADLRGCNRSSPVRNVHLIKKKKPKQNPGELTGPLVYFRTRERSSWFWMGRPSRSWGEPMCLSTCLMASMEFTRPLYDPASSKYNKCIINSKH